MSHAGLRTAFIGMLLAVISIATIAQSGGRPLSIVALYVSGLASGLWLSTLLIARIAPAKPTAGA
jgi:hypothetical protein